MTSMQDNQATGPHLATRLLAMSLAEQVPVTMDPMDVELMPLEIWDWVRTRGRQILVIIHGIRILDSIEGDGIKSIISLTCIRYTVS